MKLPLDVYEARRLLEARRASRQRRERLAVAALSGILANPHYAAKADDYVGPQDPATAAVYHADRLIEELNKGDQA